MGFMLTTGTSELPEAFGIVDAMQGLLRNMDLGKQVPCSSLRHFRVLLPASR